jgi:hypothetical protein
MKLKNQRPGPKGVVEPVEKKCEVTITTNIIITLPLQLQSEKKILGKIA